MARSFSPPQAASRTSTSSESSDLSSTLPFPEPLPRSAFLTPDFNPQTFLSSLGNRHQTLEDLRSDLHARSQGLSQELLNLVNAHYQDFLALGSSVKGQGEKVEELRVGVMGVRREVEQARNTLAEREQEVGRALEERKAVSREIETARRLLAWEDRINRLEARLEGGEVEWDSEEASDEDESEGRLEWLKRRVRDHGEVKRDAERLDMDHPFVGGQFGRVVNCGDSIRAELRNELKERKNTSDDSGLLDCLSLLGKVGGEREGVKLVKIGKGRR